MQKAFEEEGIEFAHKEVRVHFVDHDEDQQLTPAKKSAIAGAAAEASEADNRFSDKFRLVGGLDRTTMARNPCGSGMITACYALGETSQTFSESRQADN